MVCECVLRARARVGGTRVAQIQTGFLGARQPLISAPRRASSVSVARNFLALRERRLWCLRRWSVRAQVSTGARARVAEKRAVFRTFWPAGAGKAYTGLP